MIAINPAQRERQLFEPGELVRHQRYKYRGVVVDRDDSCRADDEWYFNNQTQPDRDQPWYHVLVDGSSMCTYAAAENLLADTTELPIRHPFLPYFFSEFKNGRYVRNDQPWPG